MGVYVFGGRVTLPAGAITLYDLLLPINSRLNEVSGFATVSMRADPDNAGTVYWSDDSAVTTSNDKRCGFLDASEAYNIGVRGHIGLQGIYLVGTVGDHVFIFASEM